MRVQRATLPAALLLLFAAVAGPAAAQEPPVHYTDITYGATGWTDTIPGHEGTYYFYRGLDFGSQSLVHPLRLIVNGGYGIMQMGNVENRPGKVPYATGAINVLENLAFPGWAISEQGFWEFFTSQVIPISLTPAGAQYWPNYMNHLVGGGMSWRMMVEYYRYHEWRHPHVWAGVTIFAYHFLNETVENGDKRGPDPDPVADFWIFNPAGILLFSSDSVARFFSETLHLTDWSYQPVIMAATGELRNVGQNYAIKWHLDREGHRSLFYHWGNQAELGMSFTDHRGRCVSFGVGLIAKNLVEVDQLSKTADLATSAGLFYDRNNSLLASVQYAKSLNDRWRLNLYPGLVRLGPLRPGFMVTLGEGNEVTWGVTFGRLTHLPVGLGGSENTD